MASGTIRSNSPSGLDIILEWTSYPNAADGTSDVNVKVYISHRDIYCAALQGSYVSVGSETISFTASLNDSDTSLKSTLIADKTFRVTHDSNGKKSVGISACWVFNGTYAGYYVGSLCAGGTVALDTLNIKSVIESCPRGVIGQPLTLKVLTHSPSVKHKIKVEVGTESYTTGFLTDGNFTAKLPSSLAYGMLSSSSADAAVTLLTYDSSEYLIGEDSAATVLSVTATDTFTPTFELTLNPFSLSSFVTGREIYAAGVSKLSVLISNASGKLGASIRSYEIKIGSNVYDSQSVTTDWLSAGTVSVTAKVTDSRGICLTKVENITVEPYFAPYFSYVEAYRCDANGVKDDEGNRLAVKFESVVFPLDGENSTYTEGVVTDRNGSIIGKAVLTEGEKKVFSFEISPEKSYTLSLVCRDSAGKSATHVVKIPTKKIDMHMRNGSVRFGGLIEKEGFDCSMDADFGGSFSIGGNPVGDFVTESGKDGIWTWRKWNNGTSECFGIIDSKTYDVSTPWGSLFRSYSNEENANSADYPENLFVENPLTFADIKRTGLSVMLMKRDSGSKTKSPNYFIVAGASGTYDAALYISARGRWK